MVDNLARKLDNAPKAEIEISEAPVKWCSVSLAEMVERGKRLEASSYDINNKKSINTILNCKYGYFELVGENSLVKRAYHAPRFKRNYVTKDHERAVGFLGSSDMLDIKPQNYKYITTDLANRLNLFCPKNTVLVSCSGTIGNVSYVTKTLLPFAFSQHIIRLECEEYSGYIYCCMKNQNIQTQLQSLIYGAVIQEIEPEHLSRVYIPNAPDSIKAKINDLIMLSYDLRDESNALIDQAQALLVKELNLPPISEIKVDTLDKSKSVQTFNVKLSEMAGRADASYHVPIVDAIVDILKKNAAEVTTVGDERISKSVVLAGVFKRTYVEEEYGYPFLGGKEITQLNPKTEKFLSKAIHKSRYEKELKVTENTVLVTDRGTIGTVALVPKHWNNYAVSQNVLKLVPANNDIAGYIYIFLSSECGRILLRRQTYGSVVDMIDNHSLEMIEFPLLKNQDVQKQINDLALQANEKRYQAYLLEQEALKVLDEDVIYAE